MEQFQPGKGDEFRSFKAAKLINNFHMILIMIFNLVEVTEACAKGATCKSK